MSGQKRDWAYESVVTTLREMDTEAAEAFADRYWAALNEERPRNQMYGGGTGTGIDAVLDETYDTGTWFDIGVAAGDLGTRLRHCEDGEEMADAVEAYVVSVETDAYREAVDAVVTGVLPEYFQEYDPRTLE